MMGLGKGNSLQKYKFMVSILDFRDVCDFHSENLQIFYSGTKNPHVGVEDLFVLGGAFIFIEVPSPVHVGYKDPVLLGCSRRSLEVEKNINLFELKKIEEFFAALRILGPSNGGV